MVRTLVIVVAALTFGCGWRYAGEMETRRTARPEQSVRRPSTKKPTPQPAPAVLQAAATSARVIRGARDLFTLGENHRASLSAPPSQMHHHAFEVRLGDALNDARQLMHCASGTCVRTTCIDIARVLFLPGRPDKLSSTIAHLSGQMTL